MTTTEYSIERVIRYLELMRPSDEDEVEPAGKALNRLKATTKNRDMAEKHSLTPQSIQGVCDLAEEEFMLLGRLQGICDSAADLSLVLAAIEDLRKEYLAAIRGLELSYNQPGPSETPIPQV